MRAASEEAPRTIGLDLPARATAGSVVSPDAIVDPLDEMVANWRRRSAERRARRTERAERLRSHLPAAKKLLHERHGARRVFVFVFGSLARGDTTGSSDVDLVELETASESLRMRIEAEGIEL